VLPSNVIQGPTEVNIKDPKDPEDGSVFSLAMSAGKVRPAAAAGVVTSQPDGGYERVEVRAVTGIESKEKNAGIFNGNEWLSKNPEGFTDNLNEQCETPDQGMLLVCFGWDELSEPDERARIRRVPCAVPPRKLPPTRGVPLQCAAAERGCNGLSQRNHFRKWAY
jgi:hypothetical protein